MKNMKLVVLLFSWYWNCRRQNFEEYLQILEFLNQHRSRNIFNIVLSCLVLSWTWEISSHEIQERNRPWASLHFAVDFKSNFTVQKQEAVNYFQWRSNHIHSWKSNASKSIKYDVRRWRCQSIAVISPMFAKTVTTKANQAILLISFHQNASI